MISHSQFIHPLQLRFIRSLQRGEEGQSYSDKLDEYKTRINSMPKVYEQEGVKDPIVYLHYFVADCDWYITERDLSDDQHQAYGYAILNGNEPEAGYISLVEMFQSNRIAELDLWFEPTPRSQIKKLAEHYPITEPEPDENISPIGPISPIPTTLAENIISFPTANTSPLLKKFPLLAKIANRP